MIRSEVRIPSVALRKCAVFGVNARDCVSLLAGIDANHRSTSCSDCPSLPNSLYFSANPHLLTGTSELNTPAAPGILRYPIEVDPQIDPNEWESFRREAVGGTLFHSLDFLAYHPPERFNHCHLTFRRKGNIVGLITGALREENGELVWISHPGASYGGAALARKLLYHQIEETVEALVLHLKSLGVRRIRITPPPVIYGQYPEQAVEFALWRTGFNVIRTELTQAVPLDFCEDSLLDGFVNKSRTAFRKAEREGLQFRIIETPTDAEFDRFWVILEENRRGLGVVPTHNRQEIELLHKLIPENLMMAAVERDGEMAAVIWNFICTDETVLEFYMAHEASAQIYRPVPFLTYHSLLWAKRLGFKWFDFGISSIWGDPTWGLLRFKENFAARHFLRQTFEKAIQA